MAKIIQQISDDSGLDLGTNFGPDNCEGTYRGVEVEVTRVVFQNGRPVEATIELDDIPDWIDAEIMDLDSIAEIRRGYGCDTGTYTPAMEYAEALATMAEHGDDVLGFIEGYSEIPEIPRGESWAGIACMLLSHAVEIWAQSLEGSDG